MADLSQVLQSIESDDTLDDSTKAAAAGLAAALQGAPAGAPIGAAVPPSLRAEVAKRGAEGDLASALGGGAAPAPAATPFALASAPPAAPGTHGLLDAQGLAIDHPATPPTTGLAPLPPPDSAIGGSTASVGGASTVAETPPQAPEPAPAPTPTDGGGDAGPEPSTGDESTGAATDGDVDPTTAAARGLQSVYQSLLSGDEATARESGQRVAAALAPTGTGAAAAERAIALLPKPDGDTKLTPEENASFEADKRELAKATREARDRVDWSEVAELVGHAMVRFAAASYGRARHVDLSHVDQQKSDWEAKRRQILEDYKVGLDVRLQARKERVESVRENRRRDDAVQERGADLTFKGAQEDRETERANARARQSASETNARIGSEEATRAESRKTRAVEFVLGEQGRNYRAKLSNDAHKAESEAKATDRNDAAALKVATAKLKLAREHEALAAKAESSLRSAFDAPKESDRVKALNEAKDFYGQVGVAPADVQRRFDEAKHLLGDEPEAAAKALKDSTPKDSTTVLYRTTDGQAYRVAPKNVDAFEAANPGAKPALK